MTDLLNDYQTLDDDEKLELLTGIVDELSDTDTTLLIEELKSFDRLDEDIVIEILKVLSLYTKNNNDKIVDMLFQVFQQSDDLIKSYSLQGLEHLDLNKEQTGFLKEFIKTTEDEDLKATAEFVVFGRG